MRKLRKRLIKNNLKKLKKLGLNDKKWKKFFRLMEQKNQNLIISLCGSEAMGKTSLGTFLTGILIPDMFLPTDFIRKQLELLVPITSKKLLDSSGIGKEKFVSEMLKKSILEKVTEASKIYSPREIKFLSKLSKKENFLISENNLYLLGLSFGVIFSKTFKEVLFSKRKRIFIIEGIHIFAFPYFWKNYSNSYLEKNVFEKIIKFKIKDNNFTVIPFFVAAKNQKNLIDSYYLKRKKFRKDFSSKKEILQRANFICELNEEIERNAKIRKINLVFADDKNPEKKILKIIENCLEYI